MRSIPRAVTLLGLWLIWTLQAFHAQPVTTHVDTENSVISYSGDALLHGWTGVSHSATGTLIIDLANPAGSRIDIAAPIESFDSGNGTRDANMLDAVEIEKYPEVRFVSTQVAAGTQPGTWQVTGHLSLHGQTHPLELPVQITIRDSVFEGKGTFEVSMTHYGIERPKIMFVPVADLITVEFTIRAPLPATAR